jgi:pimeloyl-ACP methyl ester carboxylesterase
MGYLTTPDTSIYYEIQGTGTPILFIHGMGLTLKNWDSQASFLAKQGFQVISVDLRGHGRSTPTSHPHLNRNIIYQATDDLVQLLKDLKHSKVILVAYSTGTVIAQQFALTYPTYTKALVLSGSFPKIHNLYLYSKFTIGLGLCYARARKVLEAGVALTNGKDNRQRKLFFNEAKKVNRSETIRLIKDALQFDCRSRLDEINSPILVTYGQREKGMMTYRRDYLTQAKSAEVVVLPAVKHATATKKDAAYNDILLHFLKGIE